jgi:hypothetical protein
MKPVPRSYGISGEFKPVNASSYGVVNGVSVLVSVADPSAPMSLLQKQLRLEARVGIGRLMPVLLCKNILFPQQIQATLALLEPTELNSFTEGFTEG